MKNRRLDRELNELWTNFFTSGEKAIAEQAVNLRWDLIQDPNHKLAFLYSAAYAIRQKHIEEREDQQEKYRMDRLESIALQVESKRAEQRERMFGEYLSLEREKQSQLMGFAYEWMERQEGLEREKQSAMIGLAREAMERQDTISRYALDRGEDLERELEDGRSDQRERHFQLNFERDRQYQQHTLDGQQRLLEAHTESSKSPEIQHSETIYHTIGDCILGPIGPTGIVVTVMKDDVEYSKCRLMAFADKRSVLGLQFLNQERRREAGCPLYQSRNIMPRALPIYPPLRHITCDLAEGGWVRSDQLPKQR